MKTYVIKIFYILAITAVIIIFFVSLNRVFNHDEFEAVHTSWKILNHKNIYIGFFQHHHPLFYYCLAPIVYLFGDTTDSIFVARAMMFLCLIFILAITYLIAKMIFDKKIALLSLVFLSTALIFINKVIEIRPDVPQTLFGLLSIWLLLSYFGKKSLKYILLSSLSLAISFLFLQKAIFLIAIILGILIFKLIKKCLDLRDFMVYIITFLIIILPFLFYLLFSQQIHTYVIFNWIINLNFGDKFSPLRNIIITLAENTILWFFYVLAFFL